MILELGLPWPCPFKALCFGRLCSDSKVIITVHMGLVSGNGFWSLEWVLGKNLQVNGANLPLALMASWMKGLVTGGLECLQPCLFHETQSRTGEEANYRAAGPLSSPAPS